MSDGPHGRLVPGIGYWTLKAARLHPDRTALVTPEGRFTYAELEARVARCAVLLEGLGVADGRRFGILMHNDRRFLELLFAAGRTGAVAVPLNWRLKEPELAYQIGDAGVELLFVGRELEETGHELAREGGLSLVTSPGEYDERLAAAGNGGSAASGGTEGTDTRGGRAGTAEAITLDDLPGDADPVLQVYTSGTTGRPKGAVLSHANMLWNAVNDILALGLDYRDVTLTVLPLMHVGGINLFTLPTLLVGGTVVMPRGFEPAETLRLIAEERVTLFIGVPTVHKMLVEAPEFAEADLGSLRVVCNGGDRCPLEVVAAYERRGVTFAGGYGLTETAPTAYLTEPDQTERANRAEGFAGKPTFGLDVRYVDAEGRDVEPGEVGEIWLRGPNVFLEYWNRPEATEEAFEDGWFKTGDLAWRDEDGFAFIAGRKKEMIKSGGENIYPAEVERVLLEHPDVAEACVIGRAHAKWNEVPFAVVAPRPGAGPGDEELRAFCLERLAKFKVPVGFAFVEALPRTAIGKPDRAGLEAEYG